jgi:hypothetical protein
MGTTDDGTRTMSQDTWHMLLAQALLDLDVHDKIKSYASVELQQVARGYVVVR